MSAGVLSRGRAARLSGRILGWTVALGLTALMVGGIVHIATVFLVPGYVPVDGWTRLSELSDTGSFAVLEDKVRRQPAIVGLDPLFVHAACRIDLSESPVQVILRAPDRFWSLALFDPRGVIIFSLNDRTSAGGELHMLAVTPSQNAHLKEAPPRGIEDIIVVESNSADLVALTRLYAPTDGARRAARQIAAAAECSTFPLLEADSSG